MPRMSKKRKQELSFYLNDRGRVTYNELCRKCQHGCKQSFRAVVIDLSLIHIFLPQCFGGISYLLKVHESVLLLNNIL